MFLADDIYLGGYHDFSGVAEPVTVHISGAAHAGGVAAVIISYAIGISFDYVTKDNEVCDRIAAVIYYCSALSAVAFFGLSKPIQSISASLDVKGTQIDGAIITAGIAVVAHAFLIGSIFSKVDAFQKIAAKGKALLFIGATRKTSINTKLLIRASLIALTLPLSRGFSGYVLGLLAQLACWGTLLLDSAIMWGLGAR